MTTTMANNWENHLKDDPSNEFSNKTMDKLFEAFGPTKDPATCMIEALSEQQTVFLAQAPISNHILFLHHFSKIGGTRMEPDKKHFVLVGTGSHAYPAQVNESIFDTSTAKVPSWNSFTALADADAVKTLTTRANAMDKEYRNCIPLPPFLATHLIHQGGSSIPELIMTAMTTIKAFDEEHKDEADVPSANTNCQLIVNWLFLAHGKSLATFASIPSIDVAIMSKSAEIHDSAILPTKSSSEANPSVNPSAALSQLAINVGEQTSVLEKINNFAEESAKKKTKGFGNLHPIFQKMILFASSDNGTDSPSEQTESCSAFFDQKSSSHAQIHLHQTLLSTFKCSVSISIPFATALYHGNFVWDRADTPNNFCSLLLGKPLPLSSNGTKEAMILHLKSKKGSGWSDADLAKATNQSITLPTTVDSMIHNINNLAATSEVFFGNSSLLTEGLRAWRNFITSNLTTYEAQAAIDPLFIAKVLTAIDTRVNCWLEECSTANLRSSVDDSLVDFSYLHRQIRTRSFNFSLPASIAHPNKKKRNRDSDDHDGNDRNNKRSPIQNADLNPRWKLKAGEDYNTVFKNKHVDKRPLHNNVRMCPRWHIRGICFSGCNLATTHVTITDDTTRRAMDSFCKLCRNE